MCIRDRSSRVIAGSNERYTFSGISFLSPRVFLESSQKHSSLAVVFKEYIDRSSLSGELFSGDWLDVGTIERLNRAEELIHNLE